jgi:hypothetical protein
MYCLPGEGPKRTKVRNNLAGDASAGRAFTPHHAALPDQQTLEQGERYAREFGDGAIVLYHGFVAHGKHPLPPKVMVLDWAHRPQEPTRREDGLLWPDHFRIDRLSEQRWVVEVPLSFSDVKGLRLMVW